MLLTTIAPGFQLDSAPAASYARALAAGCPVGVTSAYRTPAYQAQLRSTYLGDPTHHAYAAPVSLSEHVTGQALDLPRDAVAWLHTHPDYGFVFTDPTEWWHVAYRANMDQHISVSTTIESEQEMVIYRSTAPANTFGVLAHNGGFVLLASQEEHDNVLNGGGHEVWLNPGTLDQLIADARAH